MGKVTKRLIHGLLTMMGFSACTCVAPKMYGTPVAEYGTPHVTFTFKGRVLDKDGNPIPGIKVTPIIEVGAAGDAQYTNVEGKVEGGIPWVAAWDKEKIGIAFEDEDGPENGGAFAPDTLYYKDLNVKQVEEGRGWDEGTFHADFEKTLSPEE